MRSIKFITDFEKSRENKIGASEIAACLPHPEKNGSVLGYDETALTVWQRKTGRSEKKNIGIFAEFGSFIEPFILNLFLKKFDPEFSEIFFNNYLKNYNSIDYLHHTEADTDYAIAHTDCVNFQKKIIIEAKSRSIWLSNRRGNIYDGYDLTILGHQGIHLADYFQTQYQAAVYSEYYDIKFEKLYLAVLFDRSPFAYWEFEPDKKVQERLLEVASYMKNCIDKDIAPRELAMNQSDIKYLYPVINEDYRIVSDEELNHAIELARIGNATKENIKKLKLQEEEINDSLSIILKDAKVIKGIIDNQLIDIAAWQTRNEFYEIKSPVEKEGIVKYIEKNDKETFNYLKSKGYIKKSKESKFVKIKFKDE